MKFLYYLLCLNLLLAGCGSSNSNSTATPLITYRFTATVKRIYIKPDFAAAIGDKLSGTFSYSPATTNLSIVNNQGNYRPSAPANVQFDLNNFYFHSDNSDPNYYPAYNILIQNDSLNPFQSDFLEVTAAMPVVVNQTHTDHVNIIFFLQDLSSKVFSDNLLPQSINTQDFSAREMSITSAVTGTGTINWNLDVTIDEITKI